MTRADDSPRRVVIAFNEAINRRDLAAVAALMTDDHTFVDSAASSRSLTTGTIGVRSPRKDATVTAMGRSACSNEPALGGPAIWTARTCDGKVSEWRVHEDTPANRRHLGI
jgi:hypothetical protein